FTSTQLFWNWFAAGVLWLLVVGQVYGLRRTRQRIAALAQWRTARGEIIQSEVKPPLIKISKDQDVGVAIRYRYSVAGTEHQSTHIRTGEVGGDTLELDPKDLVAKYPIGARVDVYYDPENPSHAALERTTKSNPAVAIVFLAVFGFIAAILTAHGMA